MTDEPEHSKTKVFLPYALILHRLIESVMRAQLEVVRSIRRSENVTLGVEQASDLQINSHFEWLVDGSLSQEDSNIENIHPIGREGIDRHIYDAPDPDWSFVVGLRQAFGDRNKGKPTRISCIVKNSFDGCEYRTDRARENSVIKVLSPLNIVMDILSDPESPGANAYPLYSLRSYIFESLDARPEMFIPGKIHGKETSNFRGNNFDQRTFSVDDLSEALGRVWTSFRPRGQSRGKDPISPRGQNHAGTVLRAWLALKGMALLYFPNIQTCEKFLESGQVYSSDRSDFPYELQRASWLIDLPDPGVIVNELWGIPLPIRGADVLFRGGLRFPESGGLVLAIHGDPGAGKTSIALALGAHLVPFGIKTLFITADGKEDDLRAKVAQLVPNRVRRLSFFPSEQVLMANMSFEEIDARKLAQEQAVVKLIDDLDTLSEITAKLCSENNYGSLPCHGMVVLDGLHDLFADGDTKSLEHLYRLVASCRALKMLVLLTSGGDWEKNSRLDYLVDVSMRLEQEHISEYGAKPDRRITLTKTRHQLSALGKHGFRLDGQKGVRFSAQINYGLDVRSIVSAKLPDDNMSLRALKKVADLVQRRSISSLNKPLGGGIREVIFREHDAFVDIYPGSHVFINGRGSSGKAGLALKIACSPPIQAKKLVSGARDTSISNVLIVSFLYPDDYYRHLHSRLIELQKWELANREFSEKDAVVHHSERPHVRLKVIHLYPGYIRPDDLFNRIDWELESAKLNGLPYDSMIVDGLHNVPIQFPELEKHSLLWPQLYQSLRTREVTVITTHTTLVIPNADNPAEIIGVDDRRSEPLRHALVQKTDFQLEIDPFKPERHEFDALGDFQVEDLYSLRVLSAIKQPIPQERVFWSRNQLVLFADPSSDKGRQLSLI